MQKRIHDFITKATKDLGPVLHEYSKDYDTILLGMSAVLARVIQSTPRVGFERETRDVAIRCLTEALDQFLDVEKKAKEAKDRALRGVEGFTDFGKTNGHDVGPDVRIIGRQGPIDPEDKP